jgi:hypothetical protein
MESPGTPPVKLCVAQNFARSSRTAESVRPVVLEVGSER